MPVSEETYKRVALEDQDSVWELDCGRLRRKPEMTAEHEHVARRLGTRLGRQLDEDTFDVAVNGARLRWSSGRYFVPDVCVVPMHLVESLFGHPDRLEVFEAPMPLIVEVWSPSTGDYDVDGKLPEYQRRGDLEIWRIHPYEETLIAWRRQPDGTYSETLYSGGPVQPVALPNVTIDLDELFARIRRRGT